MMSRLRVGGTILLALALLMAGCGDDDGGFVTSTTAQAAATTTGGGGDDAQDPSDDGDDGDLPVILSSDDCLAAASALASAFSGGMTAEGTFDPEGIEDAFNQMSEFAPSEIKDDLAVMANGIGQFYSILEAAGVDFDDPSALAAPGVMEALEEASAYLDSTEFEEASDNVSAWFESECSG